MERAGGKYPYGILPECIPVDEPADKWVVITNADTWIHGDLRKVLPGEGEDISLRLADTYARVKKNKQLNMAEWHRVCVHFGVPPSPLYSNNLMACRGDVAAILHHELPIFTAVIRQQGALGNIPDPLRLKRPPFWMADQFALSILAAERGWKVRRLTRREIAWNFVKERGGVVYHVGKKLNPFDPKRWPSFREKGKDDG